MLRSGRWSSEGGGGLGGAFLKRVNMRGSGSRISLDNECCRDEVGELGVDIDA